MYCISCKKNNVKPFLNNERNILWKNENFGDKKLTINNEMIDNGIIHIIEAGYGSKFDNDRIIIAICDDCIEKNLEDSTLLFFDSYFNKRISEERLNESKKKYRRRKNLDNLIKKK